MRELKTEWQALNDSFPDQSGKAGYGERREAIRKLLRSRLSTSDLRALAATCGSLPVDEAAWGDFHRSVIERIVEGLAAAGDRDSLVLLLSKRCPSELEFLGIEDCLVRPEAKNLKDPVLILGDAYSKCEEARIRSTIAGAVRRGFKGFGIRGNSDAEFVARAMSWYRKEKNHLRDNPEYSANRTSPTSHAYYRNPLFRWQPPAAERAAAESARQETRGRTLPARPGPVKEVTNSIGMKLVLVPAGAFEMGAPDAEKGRRDNEYPQHPVRITRPFWLGVYEVTQDEYRSLMGSHQSASYRSLVDRHPKGESPTARFPVDEVNWYRAVEFCNRLSEEERLPPYYRLSARERDTPWRDVAILGGPGYRLPTEAEWEYACRAGTATPFCFGETIGKHQANLSRPPEGSRYRSSAAAVGSFPPNAFGLHDMHGNVAEWCNDVYGFDYYEDCPIDDPPGPALKGPDGRVSRGTAIVRGGSWYSKPEAARSAYRHDEYPWHGSGETGFRLARSNFGDWQAKLDEVARRDAAVTLSGHTATVTALQFSLDGRTLASGSDDCTTRLWDVAAARSTATLEGHSQAVRSVAFSPDGTTLASGSEDGTVGLWDLATRKLVRTLHVHTRGVASVAYSPDGKTLATGSWDGTVKLWDVAMERVTATLRGHTWSVRYRPDGKMLASAGAGDRTIRLWDAATGEKIRSLTGYIGPILSLDFSPDGKTLASASGEPMIRLWDVATGKNTATLRQDFGQIHDVAFSPDGRTLASAAGGRAGEIARSDTTVRLWDLATGKSTVVLRGRPGGFRAVAFSRDGTLLASGSLDGPIKLSRLAGPNEPQ